MTEKEIVFILVATFLTLTFAALLYSLLMQKRAVGTPAVSAETRPPFLLEHVVFRMLRDHERAAVPRSGRISSHRPIHPSQLNHSGGHDDAVVRHDPRINLKGMLQC